MSTDNVDMSPDASPVQSNSVRSANNIPIYLGLTVLLIVVAIVAVVASDRAKKQANQTQNTTDIQVVDTSQFARDIVGDRVGGYIPPAPKTEENPQPTPTPPDLAPAIEIAEAPGELRQDPDGNLYVMSGDLDPSAPPVPPALRQSATPTPNIHDPIDEEALRIQQAKLQALEAAVRAGTTVPISSKRSTASPPMQTAAIPQNSYGSRQSTLNEISRLQANSDENDTTATMAALNEQISNATQGRLTGLNASAASRLRNQDELIDNRDDIGRDRWQLGTLVEPPKTDYVVRTGFVIPATMISGINSDLPGQIVAQVSQNVSDTSTGNSVLIPQGSKLIGSYVSNIAFNQRRVMVAWQRIVFPDGKALDIGSMPGADVEGYSGFSDQVNNHYLRIFGSALLMSGITASISLSQEDFDDDDDSRSAREELSAAIGQQLGQVAVEMIRKNLNISPTLEIRPGFRFNVMVTKDLTFDGPYKPYDY